MGPWGYCTPSSVIGASMCQGHHGVVNLKYGFVIMGLCGLMVLMNPSRYCYKSRTNLKFQHKPKYLFQKSSYKNRSIP
jgi:hypothetical protein